MKKSTTTKTDIWSAANTAAEAVRPELCMSSAPTTEAVIAQVCKRLSIPLAAISDDFLQALLQHNGAPHAKSWTQWGVPWKLATTDLLPVEEWQPLSKDYIEIFRGEKIYSDVVQDDLPESNSEGEEEEEKDPKNKTDTAFASDVKLIVVGRGMDDYDQQVLFGTHTKKFYYVVGNIPDVRHLADSFTEWLAMTPDLLEDAKNDIDEKFEDIPLPKKSRSTEAC